MLIKVNVKNFANKVLDALDIFIDVRKLIAKDNVILDQPTRLLIKVVESTYVNLVKLVRATDSTNIQMVSQREKQQVIIITPSQTKNHFGTL